MLLQFLYVMFAVVQSAETMPAPNTNPPPPGVQLPIDDHLWVLFAAGVIYGVYFLYKRRYLTDKAA